MPSRRHRLTEPAVVLLFLSGAFAAASAFAQTAAPAAASETAAPAPTPGVTFGPDLTLTANAGLFSDYRFRGFTQTGYKPAFQGGFDLSHASGFYIGNWNSNVEQGLYRGASLEMDFYGGYRYAFLDDFNVDIGYYHYFYPTKPRASSCNCTYSGYFKKVREQEAYVALGWKSFSAKYWYALTNYFGLGDTNFYVDSMTDTKGSSYFELNGNYDFGGGWGAIAHAGIQSIRNHGQLVDVRGDTLGKNVVDWKVGATKDLSGYIIGLSVVGTSRKNYFGTATSFEAGGGTRVLASVSRTF